MKQHYVHFLSPGTFVAEETRRPIDSWDVEQAVAMAHGIVERHAARPYGFQFTTRQRGRRDLDSHETKRSGVYYLGGKIETLAEVEARDDPKESVLRSNMRGNGWDRIVTNTNSWRWTQPLEKDDVVLDVVLKAYDGAAASAAPAPTAGETTKEQNTK